MMTFIDLFCGIGGFRLGLEQHGFKCLFSAEIQPHACQMYQANFDDNPTCDVTKINPQNLPDFDILCAGFPCQAFSKSGKTQGFLDTRGTLFLDICRIAKIKKPKILLLENVKNLLIHDNGNTFKIIKYSLENLGYHVSYQVLNAKDFGIPQNRERIIMVATIDLPYFDFNWIEQKNSQIVLKNILENNINHINNHLISNAYILINKPKKQELSGLIFAGYLNKTMRSKGVLPDTQHLSRSHKQSSRIYSTLGTHPTISSQETSGRFFILDDGHVRKLTMLECFRLMGFPDSFIKIGSQSNLYNRIGNSVCVNMISSIAQAFKNHYLQRF